MDSRFRNQSAEATAEVVGQWLHLPSTTALERLSGGLGEIATLCEELIGPPSVVANPDSEPEEGDRWLHAAARTPVACFPDTTKVPPSSRWRSMCFLAMPRLNGIRTQPSGS